MFTPTWGNDPILTMFQLSWNHQLENQRKKQTFLRKEKKQLTWAMGNWMTFGHLILRLMVFWWNESCSGDLKGHFWDMPRSILFHLTWLGKGKASKKTTALSSFKATAHQKHESSSYSLPKNLRKKIRWKPMENWSSLNRLFPIASTSWHQT